MISDDQEQDLLLHKQIGMVGEAIKLAKETESQEELEREINRLWRHTRSNLDRSFNLYLKYRREER